MADAVAYVDATGHYLGHFDADGSNAPSGALPVPINPTHGAGSLWNGAAWVYPSAPKPPVVLDATSLAAALIAKGVIAQADLNAAVSTGSGTAVAIAVSAFPTPLIQG